jgi:hypothetical protein
LPTQIESHQHTPSEPEPPHLPAHEPTEAALHVAELPSAAALHVIPEPHVCVVAQPLHCKSASALEHVVPVPVQVCWPVRFCTLRPEHCHWVLKLLLPHAAPLSLYLPNPRSQHSPLEHWATALHVGIWPGRPSRCRNP